MNSAGASFATLPQWWRDRCHEWTDRPALRHKRRGIWVNLSWGDYWQQARAIGLALADAGLQPGETLSILSANRPEWLCADLGAQAMGVVSHGLAPELEPAELEQPLRQAGTAMLLVEDAEQLVKALALRERCPRLRRIVVIETRGLRAFSDPGVTRYAELLARGEELAAEPGPAASFDQRIAAGRGEQVAFLNGDGDAPPAPVEQRELLHLARVAPLWRPHAPGQRSLSFTPLALLDERVLATGAPLVDARLVHFPEGPQTVLNDLREVAPQTVLAPLAFWEALRSTTDEFMAEATPLARSFYRRAVAAETPAAWRRFGLRNLRESLGLANARAALVADGSPAPALVHWFAAIGVPLVGAPEATVQRAAAMRVAAPTASQRAGWPG